VSPLVDASHLSPGALAPRYRHAIVVALSLALMGCGDASDTPGPASATAPGAKPSRYAGSETCASCHPAETQAWRTSHHAHAERALDPSLDTPALSQREEAAGCPTPGGSAPCSWRAAGPDGAARDTPILRAFGHDPLWQYLVDAEQGRVQVTQAAYDTRSKEWFDVYADDPREPGDWGHWTGRGMTWNTMCARCHNTGLRVGYDPVQDRFETTIEERAVGCESCHGPAAAHAARMRAGEEESKQQSRRLRAASGERGFDVCAACHSRRSELDEAFLPGDRYLDHYLPRLPDETDVYYADGQVRGENFVGTSFLGSRMHGEGVVCGDCHEPHSGTLLREGDALCLDCHSERPGFTPHANHPAKSEGARCVNCHMPTTVYMQRDPRRDHGFLIPDPALTRELGIPNACNRCHGDETVAWAAEHVEEWFGSERPDRARVAQAVAAARHGDLSKAQDLVEVARSHPRPLWRAVAVGLLPQLPTAGAGEVLADAAADPNPWVRLASARALAQLRALGAEDAGRILTPLLDDPLRAVRVEAARGLRDLHAPDAPTLPPAFAELRTHIELHLDQPGPRVELGSWYLTHGRAQEGLSQIELATRWDPLSPPFFQALAITHARLEQPQQAIEALEHAIALQPEDPMLLHDLALAYGAAERSWEARDTLERTVAAAPGFARAWYNLGLMRRDARDVSGAIEALGRATSLDTENPDAPFALALVLRDIGQLDDARRAAQAALVANPRHGGAHSLLRELGPKGSE
jgi:predicted CXXCH cytochrome family protein